MSNNIRNYEAYNAFQFSQGFICHRITHEELSFKRYLIANSLIPQLYKDKHAQEWSLFDGRPGYTRRLVTNFLADLFDTIDSMDEPDKAPFNSSLDIIFCEDEDKYELIMHEGGNYTLVLKNIVQEVIKITPPEEYVGVEQVEDGDVVDTVFGFDEPSKDDCLENQVDLCIVEKDENNVSELCNDFDMKVDVNNIKIEDVNNSRDNLVIIENDQFKKKNKNDIKLEDCEDKCLSSCIQELPPLFVLGDHDTRFLKDRLYFNQWNSSMCYLYDSRQLGEIFGGPSVAFPLLGGGSKSDEDWGFDEGSSDYVLGYDVHNSDDYEEWKINYDIYSPYEEDYRPIVVHESKRFEIGEKDTYRSGCVGFSMSSNPYNYLLTKKGDTYVCNMFDYILDDSSTLCVSAISFDMNVVNGSNGSVEFVAFPSTSRLNYDDITLDYIENMVQKYDLEVFNLDPGVIFRLEKCDVDIDYVFPYETGEHRTYWGHEGEVPLFYYLNVVFLPPSTGVKRSLVVEADFSFELVPNG